MAGGEARTHHDGGCDGETRANGEKVTSRESGKRTLDEFGEASVKTSNNLTDIRTAIEFVLDTITELEHSENTDEGHIGAGDRGCKRRRLSESVEVQISQSKLLLRSTREKLRDLPLDFDQLLEEGFARYSVEVGPWEFVGPRSNLSI